MMVRVWPAVVTRMRTSGDGGRHPNDDPAPGGVTRVVARRAIPGECRPLARLSLGNTFRPMATILHVDDDPTVALILEDTLRRAGHEPVAAQNVGEALHVLERTAVDLVISDYRMPGITGLEFLGMLQREGYDVPVIMLTGHASIEHAVTAIKAGAVDYITKPVRPQQLELAVEQALEYVRLRRENEALRREVGAMRSERQIVGDSVPIRRILQTVKTAAPTRATVLLQGESGTGKELFARAVHEHSDRRDRPFVQLNCAALPEGLIESALFGHEKGAFTGRDQARGGRVRAAPPRHAAARRGERDAPRPAGQAAARAAGAGVRARGRHAADQGGRAHHRHHQPRPRGRRGGGHVPPGPVLPAERDPGEHPAAARPARRTCRCWPCASRCAWRRRRASGSRGSRRRRWRCCRRTGGRATCASCSTWWSAR
jgi:FixJ family two-component response regulator